MLRLLQCSKNNTHAFLPFFYIKAVTMKLSPLQRSKRLQTKYNLRAKADGNYVYLEVNDGAIGGNSLVVGREAVCLFRKHNAGNIIREVPFCNKRDAQAFLFRHY